jgi:hypothetical protein
MYVLELSPDAPLYRRPRWIVSFGSTVAEARTGLAAGRRVRSAALF